MADNKPQDVTAAMPEILSGLFADFDVTVQDSTPASREVPEEVIALAQWSYDNAKKATFSFRGGKEYHGKTGESAAKAFEQDAKAAGAKTTPPSTVRVTRDGIVVTVNATTKIGRKPKNGSESSDGNATE